MPPTGPPASPLSSDAAHREAWPVCPACRGSLSLSLPDAERPERVLGVCAGCAGWFLLDEGWHVLGPVGLGGVGSLSNGVGPAGGGRG